MYKSQFKKMTLMTGFVVQGHTHIYVHLIMQYLRYQVSKSMLVVFCGVMGQNCSLQRRDIDNSLMLYTSLSNIITIKH